MLKEQFIVKQIFALPKFATAPLFQRILCTLRKRSLPKKYLPNKMSFDNYWRKLTDREVNLGWVDKRASNFQ